MTEAAPNTFNQACIDYQQLTETTPVTPDALLTALDKMYEAGATDVKNEVLGSIRFANSAIALYSGALTMNQAGQVQPPLTESQVATIANRVDVLSIFTKENGSTQTGPTDPQSVPTAGRK